MYKSFIIYQNTLYYSGLLLGDLAEYLGIDATLYERGSIIYKGNRPEGTYNIYGTEKIKQYDFQKLFNNKVAYEASLSGGGSEVVTEVRYILGSYPPPTIHKEKLND